MKKTLAIACLLTATLLTACGVPPEEGEPEPENVGVIFHNFQTDLAVRYEVFNNQQGFRVYNRGSWDAGAFRIAILALGDSRSINVPGLKAGTNAFYSTSWLTCGEAITVLVDIDNQVSETDESNNAAGYYGWCNL